MRNLLAENHPPRDGILDLEDCQDYFSLTSIHDNLISLIPSSLISSDAGFGWISRGGGYVSRSGKGRKRYTERERERERGRGLVSGGSSLRFSARLFPRRFAENRISLETNFVPLWIHVITAAAHVGERDSVAGCRQAGLGVARFPILLKSVQVKSKLYQISPVPPPPSFDVFVDGKERRTGCVFERNAIPSSCDAPSIRFSAITFSLEKTYESCVSPRDENLMKILLCFSLYHP